MADVVVSMRPIGVGMGKFPAQREGEYELRKINPAIFFCATIPD